MKTHSQRLPLRLGLSCEAKNIFLFHFAGWDESVLTSLLMGASSRRRVVNLIFLATFQVDRDVPGAIRRRRPPRATDFLS